jgi:hypothetical protein
MRIAIALAALLLSPAAPAQEEGILQDRKDFIPDPEHPATLSPGKHVLACVANAGPIIGPNLYRVGANTLVLSSPGGAYRWAYWTDGVKRGQILNYENARASGVEVPYCLVSVELKETREGSPDGKPPLSISSLKIVEATKDFPLLPHRAVHEMKTRYEAWLKTQEKDIAAGLEAARVKAKGDAAKTRPPRTGTLMYITWIEEREKLQVRFFTRSETSDGVLRDRPSRGELQTPPSPLFWGVDLGVLYELGKTGTLEKILKLPLESWNGFSPPPPLVDWRDFSAPKEK